MKVRQSYENLKYIDSSIDLKVYSIFTENMEDLIEEFNLFTTELQLSCSVLEMARCILLDIAGILTQYGNKIPRKAWYACVIYIAVQDICSPESRFDGKGMCPEVTVSDLLEKANINIMDFFSVTCVLKSNHNLSDNSRQNLIALERKYLIVSALYDKFESMVAEIFSIDSGLPNHSKQNISCDQGNASNQLMKHHRTLCWMLFIVAKAKVLWHRQELLATFHLLLCCIGEVVKITPTFLLLPPFDSVVAKSESSLTVLEVLSSHVKTKFEEVKAVHNGWLHVASELKVASKLPEMQKLQELYAQLYAQNGDINEYQFLNRDWHLLPSNTEQNTSPCKYQSVSVRRILDTADALNTILLSASDDISENLKYCFQKCTVDASAIVKKFVSESEKIFIGAFFKSHEGSDKTLAERRYKLGSRYYYIMLDALLKKESESLEPSEFSSFLQNDVFHKSLLACCLEVTLMSCGSVGSVNFTPVHGGDSQVQGIVFPWILQVFNLEAFHFFKIIESFIRGAPTITPEIVKHLKETEDKILESLAWQTGSSVFGGLSGTGCSPSCRAKYGFPAQTSSFWSPNKDPSQNFSTTPHICRAVNIFLNKVSRLANQRLESLCEMLPIEKETKTNIWTCIEHVIYKKSHLLRDRHIDQIIMCCIFAICKVMEQEVRFKTIVSCYGQLSHSSVSVYKQVLSEGEKKFITVFYNKEFNSEMKDYIISHFWNKSKTESSTLNTEQSPFVLSPAYSIPGKKNIFVTPMQKTSFKNPKEITYQRLPSYSFGSLTQSPKMLQNINDSLNVLQPATKNVDGSKVKKRLHFGAAEEFDRKVAVNSARKFLRFDQPACSKSSLIKSKSGDSEKKNERFNKST